MSNLVSNYSILRKEQNIALYEYEYSYSSNHMFKTQKSLVLIKKVIAPLLPSFGVAEGCSKRSIARCVVTYTKP